MNTTVKKFMAAMLVISCVAVTMSLGLKRSVVSTGNNVDAVVTGMPESAVERLKMILGGH